MFANRVKEDQVTAPGSTRYASNGAVRIAYEDLGGAGGEPLLLIMGLGVSRFWWPDSLVGALIERGFHVAAFDQRDAGESARFPDSGSVSPLAAVLRRRSPAYTPAWTRCSRSRRGAGAPACTVPRHGPRSAGSAGRCGRAATMRSSIPRA